MSGSGTIVLKLLTLSLESKFFPVCVGKILKMYCSIWNEEKNDKQQQLLII